MKATEIRKREMKYFKLTYMKWEDWKQEWVRNTTKKLHLPKRIYEWQ